jgi:ketosteroid isomerase-like protein
MTGHAIRTVLATAVALSVLSVPAFAQENRTPKDEPAMKLARELTDAGTKMFAAGDGVGLAAQYLEEAEIVEKTVESIGPPTVKFIRGGDEIRKLYENVKDISKFNLTNEVHYARFVTPDTLFIAGDLLMSENATTKRLPFTQVRKKTGDSWKIVCLELSLTR